MAAGLCNWYDILGPPHACKAPCRCPVGRGHKHAHVTLNKHQNINNNVSGVRPGYHNGPCMVLVPRHIFCLGAILDSAPRYKSNLRGWGKCVGLHCRGAQRCVGATEKAKTTNAHKKRAVPWPRSARAAVYLFAAETGNTDADPGSQGTEMCFMRRERNASSPCFGPETETHHCSSASLSGLFVT